MECQEAQAVLQPCNISQWAFHFFHVVDKTSYRDMSTSIGANQYVLMQRILCK